MFGSGATNSSTRPGTNRLTFSCTQSSTSSAAMSRGGWCASGGRIARQAPHREELPRTRHPPRTIELHTDRGSTITSEPVACLVSDLGLPKTHRRPQVSDDTAFSERRVKGPQVSTGGSRNTSGQTRTLVVLAGVLLWDNEGYLLTSMSCATATPTPGSNAARPPFEWRLRTPRRPTHASAPEAREKPEAVWINLPTIEHRNTKLFRNMWQNH